MATIGREDGLLNVIFHQLVVAVFAKPAKGAFYESLYLLRIPTDFLPVLRPARVAGPPDANFDLDSIEGPRGH